MVVGVLLHVPPHDRAHGVSHGVPVQSPDVWAHHADTFGSSDLAHHARAHHALAHGRAHHARTHHALAQHALAHDAGADDDADDGKTHESADERADARSHATPHNRAHNFMDAHDHETHDAGADAAAQHGPPDAPAHDGYTYLGADDVAAHDAEPDVGAHDANAHDEPAHDAVPDERAHHDGAYAAAFVADYVESHDVAAHDAATDQDAHAPADASADGAAVKAHDMAERVFVPECGICKKRTLWYVKPCKCVDHYVHRKCLTEQRDAAGPPPLSKCAKCDAAYKFRLVVPHVPNSETYHDESQKSAAIWLAYELGYFVAMCCVSRQIVQYMGLDEAVVPFALKTFFWIVGLATSFGADWRIAATYLVVQLKPWAGLVAYWSLCAVGLGAVVVIGWRGFSAKFSDATFKLTQRKMRATYEIADESDERRCVDVNDMRKDQLELAQVRHAFNSEWMLRYYVATWVLEGVVVYGLHHCLF